jgi:anti-sigma28 factor (negative regulator of flagellin synthesis)
MKSQLVDQDVRQELIARIRQEIRDGVYDTPEKLETALDRLADRLDAD